MCVQLFHYLTVIESYRLYAVNCSLLVVRGFGRCRHALLDTVLHARSKFVNTNDNIDFFFIRIIPDNVQIFLH